MANSADITFSHNTFTGMSLVQTQRAHANILFDSNRLDGNNVGPDNYEGRLTIRGYDNTRPVGVTIRNNHFGSGCSDGVQVIGGAYGVRIGPGNEFTIIRQADCAGTRRSDPDLRRVSYGHKRQLLPRQRRRQRVDSSRTYGDDTALSATTSSSARAITRTPSRLGRRQLGYRAQHVRWRRLGEFAKLRTGDHGFRQPRSQQHLYARRGNLDQRSGWGTNDHNLNSGEPGSRQPERPARLRRRQEAEELCGLPPRAPARGARARRPTAATWAFARPLTDEWARGAPPRRRRAR